MTHIPKDGTIRACLGMDRHNAEIGAAQSYSQEDSMLAQTWVPADEEDEDEEESDEDDDEEEDDE